MLTSIKSVLLMIVGFLLISQMLVSQEKPRMAVLNFATRGALEEADAITEELRNVFVKSGKYTVIDRTQTEQILKEWETQQSGLTDDQKAISIGKLHNVKLIVTGKLNQFAGGGWQVSAVMLDVQTGVTLQSETLRHKGDFFTLLDQKVPGLAMSLAGSENLLDTESMLPDTDIEDGANEKIYHDKNFGIRLQILSQIDADAYGYSGLGGLFVKSVDVDSPASEAGIKTGYLIRQINRQPVQSIKTYQEIIGKSDIGKNILFLVRVGAMSRYLVMIKERK